MKFTMIAAIALFLGWSRLCADDKTSRDQNSNIVSTERPTTPGDSIVRDANGAIIGRREYRGDGSAVIRDANGNIVGRENRSATAGGGRAHPHDQP